MAQLTEREDIERSLIGCILKQPQKVMPYAVMELKAEYFHSLWYSNIYVACKIYYQDNKGIDPVTISNYFGSQTGEVRNILLDAFHSVFSIDNFEEYINIISEKGRLALAKVKIENLLVSCEGGTIEAVRSECSNVLNGLQAKGKKGEVSIKDGIENIWNTRDKAPEYIQTGFPPMDRTVLIKQGDYIVIGARPSMGKTALTLQIAMKMAEKYNVAYFSLETGSKTLYERMLACYTGTNLEDIKKRNVSDWGFKQKRMNDMQQLKFTAIEASGWTVEQIKSKAIQLQSQIVFIDYLGLVQGQGSSTYERVSKLSMDIHTMAQQLGFVVFCLVQLNRSNVNDCRAPTMADIRDSGQVEQDADVIMMLYNHTKGETYKPTSRCLSIQKNKEGITGDIKLFFQGNIQKFTELTEVDYD